MNKNKSLLLIGAMIIFIVFDIKLMSTIIIDFGLKTLYEQSNTLLSSADYVMHTLSIYLYFETVVLSILLMMGISLVVTSLLAYWAKQEKFNKIYKNILMVSFSLLFIVALGFGLYALVIGNIRNYNILFITTSLMLLLVLVDVVITYIVNHKRTKVSIGFALSIICVIFTVVGAVIQFKSIENQTKFYNILSESINGENEYDIQFSIDTEFFYLAPKGLLVGPSKIGVVIIQTTDIYDEIKDIPEVRNYINSPSCNYYLILASMFGIAAIILKDDELENEVSKKVFKKSKEVEDLLDELKSNNKKVKSNTITQEEYDNLKTNLIQNVL